MSVMKVSDELFSFCLAIDEDADLHGSEPQDWVYGALGDVRKERLGVFRDYLNELLSGDLSDDQLSKLYNSVPTERVITRGVRYILEMARDAIDENLRPGAPDRIELAREALLQRLRDAE